ncbi:hypothetical protein [Sphingomonas sp. VDB2]
MDLSLGDEGQDDAGEAGVAGCALTSGVDRQRSRTGALARD